VPIVHPVHPPETVDRAIELAGLGRSATEIAARLGVPRTTVRDWLAGLVPTRAQVDRDALPDVYVYLLGLYLGDGCLSQGAGGVFRLRVFLDSKYPGIVDECAEAIAAVRPGARVGFARRPSNGAVEVYSYWKQWAVLFPQHGPGRKHLRRIALEPWQQSRVDLCPDLLLRGLIHSDGCRFVNTGSKGWRHPRYSFSNRSDDIRAIFCAACERLDLRWTAAPHTVYVSRKDDVRRLDHAVGPKA
jgi:hypothetical protein